MLTWNNCRPVEQQTGGTAEVDIRVIVYLNCQLSTYLEVDVVQQQAGVTNEGEISDTIYLHCQVSTYLDMLTRNNTKPEVQQQLIHVS